MRDSWHHAPPHIFEPKATYIVTASTLGKRSILDDTAKLTIFTERLHGLANERGWRLDAWAILTNHYHVVLTDVFGRNSLSDFVSRLHSRSATDLNRLDQTPGRRIWFQHWDTRLTNRASLLARLRYVHFNPAKHGVCLNAANYPWCSASWFLENADQGFKHTVLAMPIDALKVPDDF